MEVRDDIFAKDGRIIFHGVGMAFCVSCRSRPALARLSGGLLLLQPIGVGHHLRLLKRRVVRWICDIRGAYAVVRISLPNYYFVVLHDWTSFCDMHASLPSCATCAGSTEPLWYDRKRKLVLKLPGMSSWVHESKNTKRLATGSFVALVKIWIWIGGCTKFAQVAPAVSECSPSMVTQEGKRNPSTATTFTGITLNSANTSPDQIQFLHLVCALTRRAPDKSTHSPFCVGCGRRIAPFLYNMHMHMHVSAFGAVCTVVIFFLHGKFQVLL